MSLMGAPKHGGHFTVHAHRQRSESHEVIETKDNRLESAQFFAPSARLGGLEGDKSLDLR